MLDKNPSNAIHGIARQIKIAMAVEGFQTVSYELLALLAELIQTQNFPTDAEYLSLIDSTLHLMTDLETQLTLARTALESERLIQNIRDELFQESQEQ